MAFARRGRMGVYTSRLDGGFEIGPNPARLLCARDFYSIVVCPTRHRRRKQLFLLLLFFGGILRVLCNVISLFVCRRRIPTDNKFDFLKQEELLLVFVYISLGFIIIPPFRYCCLLQISLTILLLHLKWHDPRILYTYRNNYNKNALYLSFFIRSRIYIQK